VILLLKKVLVVTPVTTLEACLPVVQCFPVLTPAREVVERTRSPHERQPTTCTQLIRPILQSSQPLPFQNFDSCFKVADFLVLGILQGKQFLHYLVSVRTPPFQLGLCLIRDIGCYLFH
jgi:hypothetical protein